MALDLCNVDISARQRVFWTTQACATGDLCGEKCDDVNGLKIVEANGGYATIDNSNYIRSVALNILLTEGRRPDSPCGWRPGTRGGHWSDSYRSTEYAGTAGSLIATLNAHKSIMDAMAELRALVTYDMQKLVKYGLATSVEVDAEYTGSNVVKLAIKINGFAGEQVSVGASLTRVKNAWAWET